MSKKPTGLFDKHGKEIHEGDFVSLDGNMTADNSLGYLPNGWTFDENDVYEVFWDERCKNGGNWALKVGCEPDTPLKRKFMTHCCWVLHGGEENTCEIVPRPSQEKIAKIFKRNAEELQKQLIPPSCLTPHLN